MKLVRSHRRVLRRIVYLIYTSMSHISSDILRNRLAIFSFKVAHLLSLNDNILLPPDIFGYRYGSCLHIAVHSSMGGIVDLLTRMGAIMQGRERLHIKYSSKTAGILVRLMSVGWNPCVRDVRPPIESAVHHEMTDVVSALLTFGVHSDAHLDYIIQMMHDNNVAHRIRGILRSFRARTRFKINVHTLSN